MTRFDPPLASAPRPSLRRGKPWDAPWFYSGQDGLADHVQSCPSHFFKGPGSSQWGKYLESQCGYQAHLWTSELVF